MRISGLQSRRGLGVAFIFQFPAGLIIRAAVHPLTTEFTVNLDVSSEQKGTIKCADAVQTRRNCRCHRFAVPVDGQYGEPSPASSAPSAPTGAKPVVTSRHIGRIRPNIQIPMVLVQQSAPSVNGKIMRFGKYSHAHAYSCCVGSRCEVFEFLRGVELAQQETKHDHHHICRCICSEQS